MISRFYCGEIDQRLDILEYDGTKCSGRYRAVIDGDQATVLQLQSVDTKDVPLSQLALCPGLTETEVLQVISHSDNQIGRLLIEKVEEEIVYRWDEVELIIRLSFNLKKPRLQAALQAIRRSLSSLQRSLPS